MSVPSKSCLKNTFFLEHRNLNISGTAQPNLTYKPILKSPHYELSNHLEIKCCFNFGPANIIVTITELTQSKTILENTV